MIALDILLDGLFAAVAAIGFGAISDPPMRDFPRIALLAAAGHALRFSLMNYAGVDIATASLAAAVTIGMGSLWLGRGVRCQMAVLYIPALLPMVPGIYAYKTVFSLIMFLQSLNDPGQSMQYMQLFFLNATVSLSVIALLAAGATLPIFVFKRKAFSLTRRRRAGRSGAPRSRTATIPNPQENPADNEEERAKTTGIVNARITGESEAPTNNPQ